MDFWWRGRAAGTAGATAAPAEEMLLADISVRLSTENGGDHHKKGTKKKRCSSRKFKN